MWDDCRCEFDLPLGGHGKRVLWSRDGQHLLGTAKDGHGASVYALTAKNGLEISCRVGSPDVAVYDAAWYPGGGCFAVSSKNQPCLLRDLQGRSRASYIALDATEDRPDPTLALAWSDDGVRLFGTTSAGVCLWDPSRPGKPVESWKPKEKLGKLSCLAFGYYVQAVAAGSFAGSVGLLDASTGALGVVLQHSAYRAGVTQVAWAGAYQLLVGGRRNGQLICYDVRSPEAPLYALERPAPSNQPIFFCATALHVLSGDASEPLGLVSVWATGSGEKQGDLPLRRDVVCAVDMHPTLPLLAATSGQRYSADPDNGIGIYKLT